MSALIDHPCPNCRYILVVDRSYVGKRVRCVSCGQSVPILLPGSAAASGPLSVRPPAASAPTAGMKQCRTCAAWMPDTVKTCPQCGVREEPPGLPSSRPPSASEPPPRPSVARLTDPSDDEAPVAALVLLLAFGALAAGAGFLPWLGAPGAAVGPGIAGAPGLISTGLGVGVAILAVLHLTGNPMPRVLFPAAGAIGLAAAVGAYHAVWTAPGGLPLFTGGRAFNPEDAARAGYYLILPAWLGILAAGSGLALRSWPAALGALLAVAIGLGTGYGLLQKECLRRAREAAATTRETETIPCRVCGSSGKEKCRHCLGRGTYGDGAKCRACEGTGTVTCDACGGRGTIERPKAAPSGPR